MIDYQSAFGCAEDPCWYQWGEAQSEEYEHRNADQGFGDSLSGTKREVDDEDHARLRNRVQVGRSQAGFCAAFDEFCRATPKAYPGLAVQYIEIPTHRVLMVQLRWTVWEEYSRNLIR